MAPPAAAAAPPASTYLFPPIAGLTLTSGASTGPAANWGIHQFASPTQLIAFAGNWAHDDNAGIIFRPGTPATVRMRVTAYACPCTQSFAGGEGVVEDDLFLCCRNANPPTLDTLAKVTVYNDIKVRVAGPSDQLCMGATAAGTAMINVVTPAIGFNVIHKTAFQDFSYQIKFGAFSAHAGETCLTSRTPSTAWFDKGVSFQTGHPCTFGFDDTIASFTDPGTGAPYRYIAENVWTPYQFDILPRVKAMIAEGAAFGMAQDLSGWGIGGIYAGGSAFGHTQMITWHRGLRVESTLV